MADYARVAELAQTDRLAEAWKLVDDMLIENPLDVRALVTGSHVLLRLGATTQSYHLARAATQLWPKDDASWVNLGHAASKLWLIDEAEKYYRRALEVTKNPEHERSIWLNLSALYLDNGRFADAEKITRQLLEAKPDHKNAQANLGFCQLARRDWEGWKGYRETIGSDWRPKVQYKDEPQWDGTHGKTVALYSDQGLGDEISFASMVPDAAKVCQKVILDCDDRLAGLFRRSFPQVKVYGTRRGGEKWAKEDRHIDASLPLGQIGEYFRTTDQSFPGTPYLVPCATRTQMWRGLFRSLKKPVIGIAWTGGVPKSNARNRRLSLNDFLPAFESIDAHWVCLQYKDAQAEIDAFVAQSGFTDIKQYPWATLTKDYDDTAALIASLDYVLCIQTAVAHTAGALGVPVTVLVPKATQWRYGEKGDSIPWYHSLRVIRQKHDGQWSSEIERAIGQVRSHLTGVPEGTGDAALEGGLWDGIDPLCAARFADRESHEHHALA